MGKLSSLTDQQLAALLKKGDRNALAEIFERYHNPLYNHAYNKLRNKEEANDVIQDLFVKLWNIHQSVAPVNLSAYLFIMLRNQVLSLIRHKKVVSNYSESFVHFKEREYAITDHLIREKQFVALIETEIAILPPRMREIFELSRKNNLSNKAIAEHLNLSEYTVADQIKKALRQLRIKMGGLIIILIYLTNILFTYSGFL